MPCRAILLPPEFPLTGVTSSRAKLWSPSTAATSTWARVRGTEPFWIGCEQAARIISERISPANKMTVSRRIKMLMADEVIDRLSVGSPDENKCSEYRYLYPPYE
ncbi:MAG: hypothetical protein ACYSWU_19510 [Planctomycetota bacterium]